MLYRIHEFTDQFLACLFLQGQIRHSAAGNAESRTCIFIQCQASLQKSNHALNFRQGKILSLSGTVESWSLNKTRLSHCTACHPTSSQWSCYLQHEAVFCDGGSFFRLDWSCPNLVWIRAVEILSELHLPHPVRCGSRILVRGPRPNSVEFAHGRLQLRILGRARL